MKEFNRVKFSVPDAPGTGTVTVGTRSDNSFFLPTEQGAVDGDTVYYVIQKSNKDTEVGIGTVASGKTEVTRDTVLSSIISGTAGTDKINIDGSAFMAFVTAAEALKSLRTVRTVTGTTDTLVDKDGLGQVTYNSASAVAVSLAQAGTSLAFLKGWLCFVRNIGAGAVTITPTTSTINGASTLVLAEGDSAMLVSDGTNYTAIVWAAPVLGMSDVERQNAGLSNINLAKALVRPVRLINQLDIGFGTVALADAGIDTDSSSGYVNDNTDGLVKPTSSQVQLSTTGKTKIGNMTDSGGLAAAFDGNTSQTSTQCARINISNSGYNNTVGVDWGSGITNTVGRIKVFGPSDTAMLGGAGGSTLKLQGSTDNSTWVDLYTSGTVLAAAGASIDVTSGITTSTAYRYHRINVSGNGTNGLFIAEVELFPVETFDNMTVVTTAQTADSSVSNARVLIYYGATDDLPTLNTDLTVEVTCDGGTNWATATLTSVGAALHQVAETADTECTAGTSFAARIKTLNGKDVSVYGVSLTVH